MSMTVGEIKEWLKVLDDCDEVGVDEGGLCLRVVGLDDTVYLEIGGIPEEEE